MEKEYRQVPKQILMDVGSKKTRQQIRDYAELHDLKMVDLFKMLGDKLASIKIEELKREKI